MQADTSAFSTLGPYRGEIAAEHDCPELRRALQALSSRLEDASLPVLSTGADKVLLMHLPLAGGTTTVAVKIFKRQSWLKDWSDRVRKSKAERSWRLATHLQQAGVGTPKAIAWLDKWQRGRLLESYYICEYIEAPTLTAVLADILHRQRDNAPLMQVLQRVAPAVRKLHEAGVAHGDLGNQNILLPQDNNLPVQFIDLNRARISATGLSLRDRARDLCRIALTGPYRKIFHHMYFGDGEIPPAFRRWERHYRRRFAWHNRTRYWRHPIRYFRQGKWLGPSPYPAAENIWLWDEKSAQPTIALDSGEKWPIRLRLLLPLFRETIHALMALPALMRRYRRRLETSFTEPVDMEGRIGVALHPHPDYLEQELSLWSALGKPPVLIRFYHHQGPEAWQRGIELLNKVTAAAGEVMVALVQDRQAVVNSEQWRCFLENVIPAIAGKVLAVQVAQAPNRVKWGLWTAQDYAQLLAPALAMRSRFPELRITGPACIDFEYHRVIACLQAVPASQRLNGLSHLLYVDRRGAPEHKQNGFSTLEKCALLRALSEISGSTDAGVIISETNWPLQHTGIYSPVGSPYTAPEWFTANPGESESDYADYMLRFLAISLCSGHVEQVFWWRLSAHGYGLVDDLDNFRPRPAFKALQFFLQLLGKACFIKGHLNDGVYCLEFERDREVVYMIWAVDKEINSAPDVEFLRALDREGETLDNPRLSGSPIYLLKYYDGKNRAVSDIR